MASDNKKRKGKNSYLWNLGLKNSDGSRGKRFQFFTPSQRRIENKIEMED